MTRIRRLNGGKNMKHPVLDRLLIAVCVIGLLGAAAFLGAVGANAVSPDFFASVVARLQSGVWARLLAFALAAITAAFALLLLAVILPGGRRQKRNFAIQKNENGTVKISVKALEGLVAKCLTQHPELKIVSSSLRSDGDAVQVDVHVTLAADISIPLAVSALQKQIKQYLEACSGVDVREVRVIVDGTTQAQDASGSPYAIPARLQTSPAFARSAEVPLEPLPKLDIPAPKASDEPWAQAPEAAPREEEQAPQEDAADEPEVVLCDLPDEEIDESSAQPQEEQPQRVASEG